MEKLEALSLALRQKAQGEADLMGLDEEYARASNLRDNTKSKINKYGTVSPLSLVADVINQSRGRKEMRELAPQRTAARTAISDNANALPLYQEQIAANKTAYDKTQDVLTQFNTDAANKESLRRFDLTRATAADKTAYDKTQDVLTQSNTDKAAKESIRRFGLTQATAKTKQNALDAKNKQDRLDKMNERTNATYINPTSQETFTVQIGVNGQAQVFDIDNKPTKMNITDLVPYTDWIAQQKALAKAKSGSGGLKVAEDPLVKVGSPDLVSQILDSEFLEPATGFFDFKRQIGRFGYGTPNSPKGEGENIQALQAKMSDVGIDSVKTNLEGLGINPTDKDMAVAFASIPDADTQPLAWAIWTRDQYLPMLQKAGAKAVANGTASLQVIDQYLAKVTNSMNGALVKYGDKTKDSEGTIMIDANGNRALVDANGNVIKEL